MLNAATKTTGVLFPVSDDRRSDNGPLFSGSIKLEDTQIPLAAFLKDAENGESQFLDLAVGARGQQHFSGRLFRNTEKKNANSPDYSGYLVVLPMTPDVRNEYTTEEWDAAPRLKVFGRRMRNADNSPRISLDIVPPKSDAPVGDDELAF
ncbi:hypothetical protein [Ralstonia thomasii]|jgi:hypothetical protein|uniref:Uncharacterized protein n=1 Tax=Ralstonia thomasii TaxID=3058596 RepID=A0ABM9JWY0_9RALS|nr:hypothetical protein [Ralstonia sp. LMG 18095]CAJ0807128.1 hypothetical protein LMG18095_04553 [Ralstonia sp. LMG 18095]